MTTFGALRTLALILSLSLSLSLSLLQLMPRECINSLFDNFTWTKILEAPLPPGLGRSSAWLHPQVSVFVILILFFIMKVRLPSDLSDQGCFCV